jgi:hypothetical protein
VQEHGQITRSQDKTQREEEKREAGGGEGRVRCVSNEGMNGYEGKADGYASEMEINLRIQKDG